MDCRRLSQNWEKNSKCKQCLSDQLKPDSRTGDELLSELSRLIEQGRQQVAVVTNSTLTLLFWQVGRRINEHILQNRRAEYARHIIPTLSAQLKELYGKSFEEKNLRRMLQFATQSTDEQIVVTVSRQLNWSHILNILPLKKQEAKIYYAGIVHEQCFSVRELRGQISRKAYERTEMHRFR